MKKRVRGKCNAKSKSYVGLPICGRVEFREWAEANEQFTILWDNWHASGKLYKLTPSVDRLVEEKGYVLENMQWLTVSENTIKENKRRAIK